MVGHPGKSFAVILVIIILCTFLFHHLLPRQTTALNFEADIELVNCIYSYLNTCAGGQRVCESLPLWAGGQPGNRPLWSFNSGHCLIELSSLPPPPKKKAQKTVCQHFPHRRPFCFYFTTVCIFISHSNLPFSLHLPPHLLSFPVFNTPLSRLKFPGGRRYLNFF